MGIDPEKKFVAQWWFWIVLLIVLTVPIMFGLRAAGIIGKTALERKVFEHSYQRSEAKKSAISTYEAQLAEIEAKLLNPQLSESSKANLKAQMASIRIMLNAERNK